MQLKVEQVLSGHTDRAWHVSWSHDGKFLASAGADKIVKIYTYDSTVQRKWICVDTLDSQHTRTVRCVAWNPNNNVLACASFDGTVTIWKRNRTGNFECISTLEGHESEVKSCAWDSSGQLLATCGRDKTVWIWEVIDDFVEFDCISVLNGHTQDVKCVQWHPTMEMLLSASYDDTIRSWVEDIDDWYCADIARVHSSTVWSISLSSTGSHLASVSDDLDMVISKLIMKESDESNQIQWTDNDKKFLWKEAARLKDIHTRTIYAVDWSKSGSELIATACGDDAIRIFGLKEGSSLGDAVPQFELKCDLLNAHETDVNCVAWNPADPTLLASASDDSFVNIYRLTS